MAKLINKLTDASLRKLGPGKYADGDGLYFQVRGPAARCWLFRYMVAGKERWMGLGAYPAVSLEGARKERDRWKRLRQEAVDPIAARERDRAAARLRDAKAMTFTEASAAFIRDKSHAWKNEKHRAQWTNTLNTYVNPTFGNISVQEIDTALVKKVLDPIWTTKPETASRVRGRIEAVLDWCKALGYREGDNPARWRGNLKDLLAAKADIAETEHHAALPYQDIPAFMERLRAQNSVAARALEWVVLTGVRVNEALKALPAEIDRNEKAWTVPKARMKGRRGKAKAHRVPLPSRAFEIIELLPRVAENPHLFPGLRKGGPITDGALRVLLARMEMRNATTHGFRASFKTWAMEQTRFPREVIEKALAHVVGDETEQAYDRGDLFEKRRKLMEAWAGYCLSKPVERRDNVVGMRAAG